METRRLVRSFGTVSGLTLLSRLLGMARDILTAGLFGTSGAISSWFVAFTIPNLFRRLFGEGALAAAFVPQFIKTLRENGPGPAWALARKISTLLIVVLGGITVAGMVLMKVLETSGRLSEEWTLIMNLGTVMLPYTVLICLVGLAMGILNSLHHFALPAFTPAFFNLVLIGALLWLCPRNAGSHLPGVRILAAAVVVGGILQVLIQIPKLRANGWTPGWDLDTRDPSVRKVMWLTLPAASGAAITQVNVLLDRVLATMAGGHGAAALNYAERLIYLPLGLFATSLGTVLLPVLSGHATRGEHGQASRTVRGTMRAVLLLMIPAATGLFVLAPEIVRAIFGRGEFNEDSTFYVTVALQVYSPLLLFASASKVLVPGFHAHQDTRTPFKVGLWSVAVHVAISVALFVLLPARYKHVGPAAGTTLATVAYFAVLAVLFHRRFGNPDWKAIVRAVLLGLSGSVVLAGVALLLMGWSAGWTGGLSLAPWLKDAIRLCLAIPGAAAGYFGWLLAFRCEESRLLMARLRRR